MKPLFALLTLSLTALPGLASAEAPLASLQKAWSVCQYRTLENQKQVCLSELSQQAHRIQGRDSDPDLLIWSAIIDSSWAGAKGGLGALSLVRQAKADLEKALAINPQALQGSAYTSLGALYYQVPGWPVGFGDDKKAEAMLQKALAINPDGIDPNYFYGDFQLEQGNKEAARRYLNKALNAAPRPGRDIADSGRHADIERDLKKLD
ncbi:tetratricopeptide repeat protein [Pantoea sp. NSTU24]|uniref:tetratricopeptide repeat protein n=1 Tax=Pantoea sp. NSTU24 TaxID=3391144 RepID=UPI003D07D701